MVRLCWSAAALCVAATLACEQAQAQVSQLFQLGPLPGGGGGQTVSTTIAVDATTDSDASFSLTVSGDFFDPNPNGQNPAKSVTVSLDGQVIDIPLDFAIVATPPCAAASATVTIPQSDLAPLIADGELTLTVTSTSGVVANCNGSSFTATGTISFTPGAVVEPGGEEETVEESTAEESASAAESLAGARAGVTLMNLPTFSTRLGGGGGGSSISGLGDGSSGAIAFSTSLSALKTEAAKQSAFGQPAAFAVGAETGGVDFWVGGAYTYFETDVGGQSTKGDVGVLQAGLDYRIGEQALVGLFVMGDLLDGDTASGPDSSGLGFLAGPYAVIGLAENVHLEGVVAGGLAFNELESVGLPTAEYESQRLLLSSRLSGDFRAGAWTLTPSTRISYYVEKQESFTDGAGAAVPEDTSTFGQLRFGPEVAYDLEIGEGGMLRPFAGVEGVWAFKQNDQTVNGATVTPDDLSGTVSVGFDASLGSTTLRAAGRYDGIGTDEFDAMTGELQLRVPLN